MQHGCVVSGCSDGSVKVWSHKGTEITTLQGHTQRVNGCHVLVKVKDKQGKSACMLGTEFLLTALWFEVVCQWYNLVIIYLPNHMPCYKFLSQSESMS